MTDDPNVQEARRRFEEQVWAVRRLTADVDRLLAQRRQAEARNDEAGIKASDRDLAAKREELRRAEALKTEYDQQLAEALRPQARKMAKDMEVAQDLVAQVLLPPAQQRYRADPAHSDAAEAELRQIQRIATDAKTLGEEAQRTADGRDPKE